MSVQLESCPDLPLARCNCCTKWQNNEVESSTIGVSCICIASASHIFANRVPEGDRRWADVIRRRHQRSPVAAVPMRLDAHHAQDPFHRDRASTAWVYLSVLHGIGFD